MHENTARGADAHASSGDPNTGRVLDGRYRIGARIARGGMASVYEATDLRLDRTVAVKIMHPGLGDHGAGGPDGDAFASRFVREARSAARLTHPHVVNIYDQGQDESDGTLFIAMELVPGHTLRDTVAKEAPMRPERALALLEPVLSALAAAHRAGLIHRDVKPENVLLADDGRIKVADFGLAKAVSADTQHTATAGVLIGTVSYLAPELVVDGVADPRADVYAAGVILYELLTGTKPHTGESPIQVAYRHVHHDVPAPSTLATGLPDYVDALVARATTRDPSLRPADAAVLLHQVHRVQSALRAGLTTDPELVEDLAPASRPPAADTSQREDTTPEPIEELWDEAEARALLGAPPAREDTRLIGGPGSAPADEGGAGPAKPRGRGRRSRRGAVLLVLLTLLAVAVAGGAYWFGWGRYTTTPAVVGMADAAAVTELEEAGFTVEHTDPAHSETVPEGEVVATDPRSGSRVVAGGTIAVTVSLGPELNDVPDVAGLTVAEATERLADAKLVVAREIPRWSETVPEGVVIRTDPAYGTPKARQLPVDSAVRLLVSRGRRPIEVRDWVGKPLADARDYWERKGLKVEVTGRENSDDVPEGGILTQEPASGTLFRDDVVRVTVSEGPELVEVPSVFYESTDDAVAALEALGLKVVKERAAIYFNGSRVYSSDPPAGTMVRKGSTVTIYIV